MSMNTYLWKRKKKNCHGITKQKYLRNNNSIRKRKKGIAQSACQIPNKVHNSMESGKRKKKNVMVHKKKKKKATFVPTQ